MNKGSPQARFTGREKKGAHPVTAARYGYFRLVGRSLRLSRITALTFARLSRRLRPTFQDLAFLRQCRDAPEKKKPERGRSGSI
jgi:hypothetical protein